MLNLGDRQSCDAFYDTLLDGKLDRLHEGVRNVGTSCIGSTSEPPSDSRSQKTLKVTVSMIDHATNESQVS